MDIEKFVNFLLTADATEKEAIRKLADRISRAPPTYGRHKSHLPYDTEKALQQMKPEELKKILWLCILIRVMIEDRKSGSQLRNLPKNTDPYDEFVRRVDDSRHTFTKKIKEEEGKIEGKKEWIYNPFKTNDKEQKRLVDGIKDQGVDGEEFEIAVSLVNAFSCTKPKEIGRAGASCYDPKLTRDRLSYGYPNSGSVYEPNRPNLQYQSSSRTPPTQSEPVSKYADEQKNAMAKTSSYFMDQLDKLVLPAEPVAPVSSTSSNARRESELLFEIRRKEREESIRLEGIRRELAQEEQEKQFKLDFNEKKQESEKREEKLREKIAKNEREVELKFKKELDEQQKEHEETMKRIQDEIEENEKENARLMAEVLRKYQTFMEAFFAGALLKQIFEQKEKEWADWLKSLKESLINAENRFKLFEKITGPLSKESKSYDKIMKIELFSLHKTTLSVYVTLFEACKTVKDLYEKYPDGAFLHILHNKLLHITDILCDSLDNIDACMTNYDLIEPIITSFKQLKPSEIPTTGELRRESKKPSDKSQIFKNPRVYGERNSVKIAELPDDYTSLDTVGTARVETTF